jgi:MraZ protein
MFRGSHNLNLDAKGRIAIPARYRDRLREMCEGELVVTFNPYDECLPIYPLSEWEECERKMEAVEDESEDFREMQRMLYFYTHDVEMDGSGRILVPQQLRELVGLEKSAVLIGHGKKFELWGEERWQKHSQAGREKFSERLKTRSERMHLGFKL